MAIVEDRWAPFAHRTVVVEAVRQAEVAYCAAYDRADAEALGAMFDPGATLRRPSRDCQGWPEILGYFRELWAAGVRPTRHLPLAVDVEDVDADPLHVRVSYLLVLGRDDDLYLGWGDYDDRLVLQDGRLVFVEKVSTIQGLFHLPGGWREGRTTSVPWSPGRVGDAGAPAGGR
ncbi:MAG TPA: nuclear transport factor 2 family protein [Acidimicrobiales bacterium]|nr:nuclear transport factor 2 family protein [Acidimicrobiales bacterium]